MGRWDLVAYLGLECIDGWVQIHSMGLYGRSRGCNLVGGFGRSSARAAGGMEVVGNCCIGRGCRGVVVETGSLDLGLDKEVRCCSRSLDTTADAAGRNLVLDMVVVGYSLDCLGRSMGLEIDLQGGCIGFLHFDLRSGVVLPVNSLFAGSNQSHRSSRC